MRRALTGAALALLMTSGAHAAEWSNVELKDTMCSMRAVADEGGGSVALTAQPHRRLLFQLFKNDWFFGRGNEPVTVSIRFDAGAPRVGQGYSHQLGRQAILDLPIASEGAVPFINDVNNRYRIAIEFADGSPPWSIGTPEDAGVVEKFVACIKRIGGIDASEAK
jgi:hypothetical protein